MILEERYVNFICDNNLTQPQFLLLLLIYKNRKDLIVKYKKQFPSEDGTMIGTRWITDLFNRKLLIKEGNNLKITPTFKHLFCNPVEVAEELLNTYPSTMEIDGKLIPLTAIDLIELSNLYMDKILENREEHEEILLDIKFGKENRLINLSLKKFIQSKYWLGIRKQRQAVQTTHNRKQANSFE